MEHQGETDRQCLSGARWFHRQSGELQGKSALWAPLALRGAWQDARGLKERAGGVGVVTGGGQDGRASRRPHVPSCLGPRGEGRAEVPLLTSLVAEGEMGSRIFVFVRLMRSPSISWKVLEVQSRLNTADALCSGGPAPPRMSRGSRVPASLFLVLLCFRINDQGSLFSAWRTEESALA